MNAIMTDHVVFAPQGDVQKLMLFEANKKSIGVAYLLWIFLGGLGGIASMRARLVPQLPCSC